MLSPVRHVCFASKTLPLATFLAMLLFVAPELTVIMHNVVPPIPQVALFPAVVPSNMVVFLVLPLRNCSSIYPT